MHPTLRHVPPNAPLDSMHTVYNQMEISIHFNSYGIIKMDRTFGELAFN